MGLFDAFRYDGKRALVVGGATGMGAAVAELVHDAGAEVIVMDRADITLDGVKAIHLDLSDTASIDAAIAELRRADQRAVLVRRRRRRHAGHRAHQLPRPPLHDREAAGRRPAPRGSAIGMISSAAGLGWENSLDEVKAYLDIADFHEAAQWARDNNKADYMWSKKSVCAYVAREAFPLLQKGIRINAILPGPTNTPLAQANAEMWLTFGQDYRDATGTEASTPLEQAYPLVFLCSDAAVGVNGITIVTDAGYVSSGVTGSFPDATPVVGFLREA